MKQANGKVVDAKSKDTSIVPWAKREQSDEKKSKLMVYWPLLSTLIIIALIVWIWSPKKPPVQTVNSPSKDGVLHLVEKETVRIPTAPVVVVNPETQKLEDELKRLRDQLEEKQIVEVQIQRQAESKIRLVNPGESLAQEPKIPVAEWRVNGAYLVPLRKMPDGMAGYGQTYSNPPSGGVLPAQSWAKDIAKSGKGFVRNERGDWAIALR